MIKSIRVRNYQSIEDITLDLGRITAIVGPTDSGKSAFLRAFQQACFNDGNGEVLSTFDGKQAKQAQVDIVLDEGTVSWIRTKTSSKYVWTPVGGEAKEFKKIGKTVPEEIQKALGIQDVQVDAGAGKAGRERLQFASQFDAPFMLVDRGGVAAARILGRLTGIHVFANASKKAQQEALRLSTVKDEADRQLEESDAELKRYEGVEEALAKLAQVQERMTQVTHLKSQLQELQGLRARFGQLRTAQASVDFSPERLQHLSDLGGQLQRVRSDLEQRGELLRLQERCGRLAASRRALPGSVIVPDLNDVKSQVALLQELRRLSYGFAQLGDKRSRLRDRDRAESEELRSVERMIQELEVKVPLCPFVQQFGGQKGTYRCKDLMKVVGEQDK